jgi:uncharacterized protein (TIGR03067 family)
MRIRLLAPVCLLVLAAAVGRGVAEDPKDTAVKEELKKLSGTWEAVSAVEDGKELPRPKGGVQAIVDGPRWTLNVEGKAVNSGTQTVDPSKTPKTIDLVLAEGPEKGKTVLGIYELKGDELKMALAEPGGKDRPKDFSGKGAALYVYKRVKP